MSVTREWLIQANEAYRKGQPICSDEEFDAKLERYKYIFPEDTEIDSVLLGSSDRKQKLPISMKSLDKCKDIQEILDWLKGEDYVLSCKMDGISLLLNIMNKKIVGAWTRGDGEFGQWSLDHVKKMGIKILPGAKDGFYAGEAIMRKSIFIAKGYNQKYANPRNLVAGIFNRKDITDELKDIDFIPYIFKSKFPFSKFQTLKEIESTFENVVPYSVFREKTLTKELILNLKKHFDENIDYELDGVVIDLNAYTSIIDSPVLSSGNPGYARAIKLPEWRNTAEVEVKGIKLSVGKQGAVTPVILIEPTQLSGVTIDNVTGHNFKYLYDHKICDGSIIEIVRSGEVIPKHLSTISNINDPIQILREKYNNCPSCGKELVWDVNEVEKVCSNSECHGRKIKKLVHFFTTVKIEGFGEPSIIKLYNAGYDNILDILSISPAALSKIDGFSTISANKLTKEFSDFLDRKVSLSNFMYALDLFDGILGEKLCQNILDTFSNNVQFLNWFNNSNTKIEDLIIIQGVSDTTAKAFLKASRLFLDEWDLFQFEFKSERKGNKLDGYKICFTGVRDSELEKLIIQNGGKISSGVSKDTKFLVAKDKNSTSSKSEKAKEFNVPVISIEDLKTFLNNIL